MTDQNWIEAAGDRLLNPAHVEQIKHVREKIVLTMQSGDTRTFFYDSEERATRAFDELRSSFAGIDIGGESSDFHV